MYNKITMQFKSVSSLNLIKYVFSFPSGKNGLKFQTSMKINAFSASWELQFWNLQYALHRPWSLLA